MSQASNKFFTHTHYGVSTVAAVLYAIVWLLGNQVHAEVGAETRMLPAVVVTAQRASATTTMLDPVVVVGHRDQSQARFAMLPPVIVTASRDVATASTMRPTAFAASAPAISAVAAEAASHTTRSKGVIAKVRYWFASASIK
jgi:hypothetical protein